MTGIAASKTIEIGVKSSEATTANLIRLRMEREADLAKIFNALGLVRGENTADDAVAIIGELLNVYLKHESLSE